MQAVILITWAALRQTKFEQLKVFHVPVRIVVRQASIAFPPFLSASFPAYTASPLPVPATIPLPSLNVSGFGRRRELSNDRASSLWKSSAAHVFGENEILSGGREAEAT